MECQSQLRTAPLEEALARTTGQTTAVPPPADPGVTTFTGNGTATAARKALAFLRGPGEEATRDGRYVLEDDRPSGQGGMGLVWRAHDRRLGRTVALKEMRPHLTDQDELRGRFLVEAQVTSQLQHPGVVPVYDVVEGGAGESPCYTMRFVEGRTLSEAARQYHEARGLDRAGWVEQRELLAAVVAACNTVAYAHSRGVVHRDLKGANVVLGPFGEVVVLDWGLAHVLTEQGGGEAGPLWLTDGVESRPEVKGTPAYMAPEQARGESEPVDVRSDVFGLGAVLYEVLTGEPPYDGADAEEVHRRAAAGQVPPVRSKAAWVPRPLAAVCMKALAARPEGRYASAAELGAEINRCLAGEPVAAWPEPLLVKAGRLVRRHRVAATAAAVALLAALAAGAAGQFWVAEEFRRRDAALEAELERERGLTARLTMEAGLLQCERGETGHGLLLLARAFQEMPPTADAHRGALTWNLSAWSRQLPAVDAVLPVSDWVIAFALSSDGRWALTGSKQGVVRQWDVRTCRQVGEPFQHELPVKVVAFSPDDATVLTGARDGLACLWDRATGKRRQVLNHRSGLWQPGMVFAAAFSADGAKVATGIGPDNWAKQGQVLVWAANTGKVLKGPLPHGGPVHAVAFSLDGTHLASGSEDQKARFWDLETGTYLETPPLGKWVNYVEVSPDGHTVLLTDGGNTPQLWDTRRPDKLVPLRHTYNVFSQVFTPDGKGVVTGCAASSGKGEIRLWDTETGQAVGEPQLLPGPAGAVRVSRDGRTVYAADGGRSTRIWHVDLARLRPRIMPHHFPVYALAFHPDGHRVLTASSTIDGKQGENFFWDVATGQRLGGALPAPEPATGVAFAPNGNFLTVTSAGVRLWDGAHRRPTEKILKHPRFAIVAAWRPDGKQVATGGEDGQVLPWDVDTGRLVPVENMEHPEPVRGLAFSPDGRWLLAGSTEGVVRRREADTGRPVGRPIRHPGVLRTLRCSPDGKTILTGGEDNTARLWDAVTGLPAGPVLQHPGFIRMAAFSPDGAWILTAGGVRGQPGVARLWDRATGKPLGPPLAHGDGVGAVDFSPDGRTVATGSFDSTARLWEAPVPFALAPGRALLWAEVHTGLELDDAGSARPLDAASWAERRRLLEDDGGHKGRTGR